MLITLHMCGGVSSMVGFDLIFSIPARVLFHQSAICRFVACAKPSESM
jgi:hypothetical protein